MKIILGSSSQFRQKVLRDMGYEFDVISPDIDEKVIRDADPEKLVMKIAMAKSEAVLKQLNEPAIVITADQVVAYRGTIREKPTSAIEAADFLRSYGQAPAQTVNGVVVINTESGKKASRIDIAEVHLHPLPESVISQLIAEGVIFHCAGAIRTEDSLVKPFVKEVKGEIESVKGLPKTLIESLLNQVK